MIRIVRYALVLTIFLGSGLVLFSQTQGEIRTVNALEQAKKLKDGALLIRLQTRQKSIDALIASERHAQAQQLKDKVIKENLELVDAVQTSFTYCPVYFFYSHDSKYISNGELDKVGFLNEQLTVDSTIVVNTSDYFTAELGLIEQNTRNKTKNIPEGQENSPKYINEPKYYGGSNMRFHAFIIKDQYFEQLSRPFPYYSRTMNSFFIKKTTKDVIEKMNQKLFKFLLN